MFTGTKEGSRNPLSLDMGWKSYRLRFWKPSKYGRNPLSLDMGWKLQVALISF